jgi:hypothetical protein
MEHIFSIKLKICGQAPVKRVNKKTYAQTDKYSGMARTFKKDYAEWLILRAWILSHPEYVDNISSRNAIKIVWFL